METNSIILLIMKAESNIFTTGYDRYRELNNHLASDKGALSSPRLMF